MRSIVWWTVWGLVLAISLLGLLEFQRSRYFLVLSIPLLTGAIAAAIHRLEHEYRHALEHAKWAVVSALFLLAAIGFLYLKARAYGPFSTATSHKALLGTTFGMSLPEVERKLGRKLRERSVEGALQERAHEWLWEALPIPQGRSGEQYSLPVMVYGTRSRVTFYFERRKLNRVELQFLPMNKNEASVIRVKLHEELLKEYALSKERAERELTERRYTKETVEATVVMAPGSDRLVNIRVLLEYLPTVEEAPAPLRAEANIF